MKTGTMVVAVAGALLVLGCGGCAKENPRVITKINQEASLPKGLPSNPLEGRVITAWVDERNATMSTLNGNDAAVEHARSNSEQPWPAGAVVSLVTWKQQEDERWFGAKIPAAVQSVEFVTVGSAPDHQSTYYYQRFDGMPLKLTSHEAGTTPNERARWLLSQRAAGMP